MTERLMNETRRIQLTEALEYLLDTSLDHNRVGPLADYIDKEIEQALDAHTRARGESLRMIHRVRGD